MFSLVSYSGLEGADRLVLSNIFHRIVQSGPPLDILTESLVLLLHTVLQLGQTTCSLVCAFKSIDEDSRQIIPAKYATRRELC
jgi:hypothetical protein